MAEPSFWSTRLEDITEEAARGGSCEADWLLLSNIFFRDDTTQQISQWASSQGLTWERAGTYTDRAGVEREKIIFRKAPEATQSTEGQGAR